MTSNRLNRNNAISIDYAILKSLGISKHNKGYQYLTTAFECIAEHKSLPRIGVLYRRIAKEHSVSYSNAELDIRNAIQDAFEHGNIELLRSLFGNKIPSNSLFLFVVYRDIRLEQKSKIVNYMIKPSPKASHLRIVQGANK